MPRKAHSKPTARTVTEIHIETMRAHTLVIAAAASLALAAPSDTSSGSARTQASAVQPVTMPGYTEQVPPLVFAIGTDACDNYDPTPGRVDWAQVRQEVIDYLLQPGGSLGPDNVPYKRVAAMMVRAGFHDPGAFHNGIGGADGSAALSYQEQFWEANASPLRFWPYVRAALWPIVDRHAISWADAIAVSGAAAAQFLGKPDTFNITVGRCDTNTPNTEGILPAANLTYTQFVDYWNSLGINVQTAAALMGAHTVVEDGTDHSNGVQQYQWGNKFFRDSTSGTIQVEGPPDNQTVTWSNGDWQYTVNDAFDAPQNIAQGSPVKGKCPFASLYTTTIQRYADDAARWETNYGIAYVKLTEVGATWSAAATVVTI